jgi:D-tyrosyl-tRNA(Tyr) deacylase
MRILIQRVKKARVCVSEQEVGAIGHGLLLFVAVSVDDTNEDIQYLQRKVLGMRLFSDEAGKMNLCLEQAQGEVLCVSQFTLFARTKKGNRPSFVDSAPPEQAKQLYEEFVNLLRESGVDVATGIFGAHMEVDLINDGPVTIWMDSRHKE